jgi:AMP nucleosidase
LFRDYLREQLEHLIRDYPVKISVGTSASEIPYPYVLDGSDLDLEGISTAELSRWFPSTDLVHIGDEVADGAWDVALDPTRPLALFDALRTDFSLARLKHYTGTPTEHFQRFVLFTNYVRYVDEFVRFAIAALARSRQPLHQPVGTGRQF